MASKTVFSKGVRMGSKTIFSRGLGWVQMVVRAFSVGAEMVVRWFSMWVQSVFHMGPERFSERFPFGFR